MQKSDIIIALVIGELIALFSLGILKNIGIQLEWLYWVWPIIVPIGALFGLVIAYFLGKKFIILWQAAKFILVGALNTFVDLGILNILILISGISSGLFFSVFKGISFIVAVINSYFWNKYWTFKKKESVAPGKEFGQFLAVSVIGFGINVGIASLVVNLIGPQFGLSEKIWANIGAIAATLSGMTWNFLGYKFIVFK
jgi:putative flippase GtrA